MIKEIKAKVLLARMKGADPWFGLTYTMNLYRGCQHRCIYCDSRSQCYQIEHFDREVLVKANAIELLQKELARKRLKGTIGTGSMNDPYMPLEREVQLTRRALEVISAFRFPVHVITKSDLVVRDLDLLERISRTYAAVSFTITAADDSLARKVEPGAPVTSARLQAMSALARAGIYTGVTLMPLLPWLEDSEENLSAIVRLAHAHGASYIICSFGVTLRDRQREFFYQQLQKQFPGMRQRYEQAYGERYMCISPRAKRLAERLNDLCAQLGLATRMRPYQPEANQQLSLF